MFLSAEGRPGDRIVRRMACLPVFLVRLTAIAAACALLVTTAASPGLPARAAMVVPLNSIHLSVRPNGRGYTVTMSGTYDGTNLIVIDFAHSGMQACGATWSDELHLTEQQEQKLGYHAAGPLTERTLGVGGQNSGKYSVSSTWGSEAPAGQYRVCAYLYGPTGPSAKPKTTATAILSIGASGRTTAAFAVVACRVQATDRPDWNLGQRGLQTVHSGTKVYIRIYARIEHALSYRVGLWKVTFLEHGHVVTTDPWKVGGGSTITLPAGGQITSSTAITPTTKNGVTYILVGSLTIEGTTKSASTQLRVVP